MKVTLDLFRSSDSFSCESLSARRDTVALERRKDKNPPQGCALKYIGVVSKPRTVQSVNKNTLCARFSKSPPSVRCKYFIYSTDVCSSFTLLITVYSSLQVLFFSESPSLKVFHHFHCSCLFLALTFLLFCLFLFTSLLSLKTSLLLPSNNLFIVIYFIFIFLFPIFVFYFFWREIKEGEI